MLDDRSLKNFDELDDKYKNLVYKLIDEFLQIQEQDISSDRNSEENDNSDF